ncbi:MAG: Gfo/Idh/MocA family oxidoreductase [Verrucomicrobia bacterium]|nr:Gfo/Idh/MocA family oxidoreductase [Verrucomicrobiota bacterium]
MSRSRCRFSRRQFLKASTVIGSGLVVSGCQLGQPRAVIAKNISAGNKLNLGIIGAGGRGGDNLAGVSSENIVALCDVDESRAASSFGKFPEAKRYRDFRVMLEKEKSLDAVVVSTPDHTHAVAAITAMRLGKHVYCEKPLTHSIYEARLMRTTAAKYQVATQMGNQGHAMDGTRRAVELVQAGVIGAVREVHVWSDRPIWPQAIDRPPDTPPVPPGLDWDLWQGPAAERPYHPAYLPFQWRGWWRFGTGALGDMACHNADAAFWALKLNYPISVEAEAPPQHPETAPAWSIIHYEFPARGGLPPVKLTWYDGGKKPVADLFDGQPIPTNGSLLVGEKGKLFAPDWHADKFVLLPKEKFADLKGPQPTIRRSPGHHQEWILACKGGPPALSNFDYAAVLTETVLLGNLALRVGKKIEWDAVTMKARNCPEADQFIRNEYRKGWKL